MNKAENVIPFLGF